MPMKPMLLTLGLGAFIASCSSAPDPVLYTLADQTLPENTITNDQIIGLSELTLPAYARNQQITTAISPYRISEDDDHRWAAPPSEALTAALSKALENSSGSTVLQRPFPAGVRPDVRLSLTFDRLLRGENGEAEMSGQYLLQSPGSDAEISRFSITVPSSGDSYEAYMAALSRGLTELGTEIAAQLAASSAE
ncbi:MAG: PqiC family protein [Pseudomonadota bacterium]